MNNYIEIFWGSSLKKIGMFTFLVGEIVYFLKQFYSNNFDYLSENVILLCIYLLFIFILNLMERYYFKKKHPENIADLVNNKLDVIPIDDLLKIIVISGGAIFTIYNFTIGFYTSDVKISLECKAHSLSKESVRKDDPSSNRVLVEVNAKIEKGTSSSIKIRDIFAEAKERELASSENKKSQSSSAIDKIELLGFRRYTDSQKTINLNHGDSLTFSNVFMNFHNDKIYTITVYLLGNTKFSLIDEQWSSSCVVIGSQWKEVKEK